MLSFFRINRLNWIGHVNRIDSEKTVDKVFNNTLQGSRQRGPPRNRWWNCVQRDNNKFKITNWEGRSKTEQNGRSPLRRRRSAMDSTAIEEEEEEEEDANGVE